MDWKMNGNGTTEETGASERIFTIKGRSRAGRLIQSAIVYFIQRLS